MALYSHGPAYFPCIIMALYRYTCQFPSSCASLHMWPVKICSMHAHTPVCVHACTSATHNRASARTRTHTHAHTRTHMHARTHARTRTSARAHTHMHACMCAYRQHMPVHTCRPHTHGCSGFIRRRLASAGPFFLSFFFGFSFYSGSAHPSASEFHCRDCRDRPRVSLRCLFLSSRASSTYRTIPI